jgi:hypothetical protein
MLLAFIEANVQIWNNEQCKTNYEKLSRKIILTMMCAGDVNRQGEADACQVLNYFILTRGLLFTTLRFAFSWKI